METDQFDEKRLLFRRQFLLSREPIPELGYWNHLVLKNEFHLYAHPDLNVSSANMGERNIILIGYILDYRNAQKTNQDIVNDIIKSTDSFSSFIKNIKIYAGQYVLIYLDNDKFNLLHDPLGLREVYYCHVLNRIICGSQPNLIVKFAQPEILPTKNDMKFNFFKNELPKVRQGRLWVGDETYYDEIKHLLPNHCFDINKQRAFRYWPNEPIQKLYLNEAVDRACEYLKGILRSASNRYQLMMAVTAGNDTRTLLAASRDIRNKIYYFINKHKNMDDKHPDILVPKAIFEKINLPFHVHEYDQNVPVQFEKIFFNNVFLASKKYLPVIYNIYYKKHSSKINLLGVGEIGRGFYGKRPRKLTGYFLARALKYKDSLFAIKECQKWLNEAEPISEFYNVDIMTLLLWEQLLGNWGVVADSESDIAIEYFDPFNSHYLYEVLLGVDKKYAEDRLFGEIINKMWPELLEFPINPPKNRYQKIRIYLNRLGLFNFFRNFIYKLEYFRFKINCRIRKTANK